MSIDVGQQALGEGLVKMEILSLNHAPTVERSQRKEKGSIHLSVNANTGICYTTVLV